MELVQYVLLFLSAISLKKNYHAICFGLYASLANGQVFFSGSYYNNIFL
jgi:hypothetical protein